MINMWTFFETEKELESITGLTNQQLWDNGFNLDDMDWGFCCDTDYEKMDWLDMPEYAQCILSWMDGYCVGYHKTFYDGRYYYTLHHA